jgi:hypothetical protein
MMNPDRHYPYQGVGEFMYAMGWTSCEGGPSNVVPSEPPNSVALPSNPSAVPPRQARKKVCAGRKNLNFSPNEDIMLIKSYLEVSCDPVVNTNQKKESLWSRIMSQYNKRRGHYLGCTMRSVQSRWDAIKLVVGKFY